MDDFKNHYTTLGVARTATPEVIKRAYRKLARKYHPDVSQEAHAESRFKEVAEAHEALIDPERRAAYDELAQQHAEALTRRQAAARRGAEGRDSRGEGSARRQRTNGAHPGPSMGPNPLDDPEAFNAFVASMFGQSSGRNPVARGADHHARIEIDLIDAYRGARHSVSLQRPERDAHGRTGPPYRTLEVSIPAGVRPGQQLRLSGQGEASSNGGGGAPAGDLYLDITFRPHPGFRLDGADVWTELPVSPWEAALGATVMASTPEGAVQLSVPAGSAAGRKLRLKGRGLPAGPSTSLPTHRTAGDLYAVLRVVYPPAQTDTERAAYAALALAFPQFDPRPAPAPHSA